MTMKTPRLRTCFISAPFGLATEAVRAALEARGVRWSDQTTIPPGRSWLEAIDEQLTKSDFVLAVIPEQQNSNVLFELGIAFARRKPILAVISTKAQLPTDIGGLTYVRSDTGDSEA